MKKILCFTLIAALSLSLVACNNLTVTEVGDASDEGVDKERETLSLDDYCSDSEAINDAVATEKDSEGNVVFTIKTTAEIKWEDSWLGFCPVGDYADELEADDYDVYYSYENGDNVEDFDKGIYHYTVNFENIEPGDYTMVLTDTDNAGQIVGQWLISVDENKDFTLNFENAKLVNEK